MKNKNNMSFAWRNYFRPTPSNLQYISVSLRTIIGGIGGTTLVMEADKWVTFSILLAGFLLDEAIKFFGHVNQEEAKRVISVEVPDNVSDEVVVTDEVKPNE